MKRSFRDSNQILTAAGYASSNNGDTPRDESDDFALQPGRWQLVADVWAPYTDPKLAILEVLKEADAPFTPRRMREFMRGTSEVLAGLMAPALGGTAAQVLAANPFYQLVKQLDDAATAARSQL
jgi:hypothetical protein